MNGLVGRILILLCLISPVTTFAADTKIYQTAHGCMACHQGAVAEDHGHHHHKRHPGKNAQNH